MSRQGRWVLFGVCAAIALIVVVSLYAPSQDDNDHRPSSYNAGAAGAKAAYLLLGKLGYRTRRYDSPLLDLAQEDAAHETLIMANPWGAASIQEQKALADFISRGGRVLGTGSSGMANLPGVYWERGSYRGGTCYSMPQGTSQLAAVGPLVFHPTWLARTDLVETEVAQRCQGGGAAVIEYNWGSGEAVWWADPGPLTNRGLHEDANLGLLLASVGPLPRTILFDESDNAFEPSRGLWDGTDGLPLRAIAWQVLAGVVLLLFSFGRRHGPVRALVTTPRTSPLEFAYSMGNLYSRGRAGEAAVLEARDRLLRVIERQCGVSRDIVAESPEAIAQELRERFNYKSEDLVALLHRAGSDERIPPAEALKLVQRFNEIANDLRTIVSRTSSLSLEEKTLV